MSKKKKGKANKAQAFAGVGGLIGAGFSVFGAAQRYDFSNSHQMGQGIGYVLGGLLVGALIGYVIGLFVKS